MEPPFKTMHLASFENCAAATITFIDATKQSLQIGICWFTHPAIFQALQKACARKVRVTIILNFDQVNFHPRGLDFQVLEKCGAEVLGYPGPGLLHFKCAVADDCLVLTGSYNWTRAEQCDHISIIQDLDLATQFTKGLGEVMARCQPLAQLRNVPPRQISFIELYRPILWTVQDLRKSVVSGAKTWLVLAKTEDVWHQWITVQRHTLNVNDSMVSWMFNNAWDEPSFQNRLLTSSLRPTTRRLLIRYCLRVQQGDIFVAITPTGSILGAGIIGSNPEIKPDIPEAICRFTQWLAIKESTIDLGLKLPVLKSGITRYKGSALELIAAMERFF